MHLRILACLTLAACGTPSFETDLLPEGDPDVTLVNVASELQGEAATYCGAPKRNLLFCPEEGDVEPIADAPPIGFYIRIAFDELLDPSIEVLDDEAGTGSIAAADPVVVNCAGIDVAYDGFYQPSGSHLTNPPGPALVIEPTGVVPGGGDCTVTIGDSPRDKSGNTVPSASRGPYSFSLAPFSILGTNPQDQTAGIDADAVVAVVFNNLVDEASLAGRVTVEEAGVGPFPVNVVVDPENADTVLIVPGPGTFNAQASYTVTISEGVIDLAGGSFMPEGGEFTFGFSTGA